MVILHIPSLHDQVFEFQKNKNKYQSEKMPKYQNMLNILGFNFLYHKLQLCHARMHGLIHDGRLWACQSCL
jgi:hypothetical protein